MITLIGKEMAKEGNSFIFQNPAEECENCRLKHTCVEILKPGRKYIIKEVKNIEHKCPINESALITIKAELSDIEMLIDAKKAFEGSNFLYQENTCKNTECENYKLCHPEGIKTNDKVTIAKDLRKTIKCEKNNKILKKILARL